MAGAGTLLPFACGVSDGGSCQKPTSNVRPSGIWERQKLGRSRTDSFRLVHDGKRTFLQLATNGSTAQSRSLDVAESLFETCRSFMSMTRPKSGNHENRLAALAKLAVAVDEVLKDLLWCR